MSAEAPKNPSSFRDWLRGEFGTSNGDVRASVAAVEILLPIVAAVIGMTAFAIVKGHRCRLSSTGGRYSLAERRHCTQTDNVTRLIVMAGVVVIVEIDTLPPRPLWRLPDWPITVPSTFGAALASAVKGRSPARALAKGLVVERVEHASPAARANLNREISSLAWMGSRSARRAPLRALSPTVAAVQPWR